MDFRIPSIYNKLHRARERSRLPLQGHCVTEQMLDNYLKDTDHVTMRSLPKPEVKTKSDRRQALKSRKTANRNKRKR